MSTKHKSKNLAIQSFNHVVEFDDVSMARVVSHNCFKFGYRVVPFSKKDDPMKSLIESSDATIDYISKRLKTLNPDRKRPAKSVTIPLVDLRSGKVNAGLEFTIDRLDGDIFHCDAFEIVTDLSGLSACG